MKTNSGYYTVGHAIFSEKIDAVLYATLNNEPVEWHFNNEIYSKVNWAVEPELSLDQFYKIRAQQIRDAYDYVIIMCSGGGDSTNVVLSFLNNGIKVDEIIASAPLKGLSRWKDTNQDNGAGNTMSETLLAQLPLMSDIHSRFPEVKITINDYFDTILNYQTDDWIFKSGEWIHPSSSARYDLSQQTHIRQLADKGKTIGIVYGIDKPILFFGPNNTIGTAITDLAINVPRQPFDNRYPNVDNVLFYYTADLPEMQVKQAHVLAKWILLPENSFAKQNMANSQKRDLSVEQSRIKLSTYERAIIPCIYPSTHRKIFQGHKPTRMFLGEHDDWFYKMHNDTRALDLMVSDFRNFIKQIDKRYLNEARNGFKLYRQSYIIGKESDFSPFVISQS